jgi:hypothetical protein
MDYLVRTSMAGNVKKMQYWPALPKNFLATAGTKNLKLVPKLVRKNKKSASISLHPTNQCKGPAYAGETGIKRISFKTENGNSFILLDM